MTNFPFFSEKMVIWLQTKKNRDFVKMKCNTYMYCAAPVCWFCPENNCWLLFVVAQVMYVLGLLLKSCWLWKSIASQSHPSTGKGYFLTETKKNKKNNDIFPRHHPQITLHIWFWKMSVANYDAFI